MAQQAADSPVELGITVRCSGEQGIEYHKGQQDCQHTDKFQQGRDRHIAILFLSCGLNQLGRHNTNAEIVAQVREMHVEVPAEHGVVVKNTKAGKNSHEAQRTIKRLINELRRSVRFHVNFLSDHN